MEPDPEKRNIIDKKYTKRIQSIVGTILSYVRSVYPTMIREIKEILQVQSRPTWDIKEESRMLLEHAAMYLNAILTYKYSDMLLHVDSDAS